MQFNRLLILLFLGIQAQAFGSLIDNRLFGQWVLTQIEQPEDGVVLDTDHYYVFFDSTHMGYNSEVNGCALAYKVKGNGKIEFSEGMCTLLCCDEGISQYLKYCLCNRYKIEDNYLYLYAKKTVYYFRRSLNQSK